MPGKRSVGLIVFMHLPPFGLVAILQKRGKFNDETMRPESYPGGCQTTVWGSAKDGESLDEALNREINEEAGRRWRVSFRFARLGKRRAIHLENPAISGGNVSVWAIYLSAEKIKTLRLSPATGGIIPITEEQLPFILDLNANYTRDAGVRNAEIIAMFADSKEILKRGFAWAKSIASPDN